MNTEQTLTYSLLSGTLDGVVKAQQVWGAVVAVYRFPRTARKEAEKHLQNSGIYFLLGEKEGCRLLYVGQSANVGKRLGQHAVDSSKDFWRETLVLTAAHQPYLNSAHLDYLENRCHAIAQEAGRRAMVNSTVPPVGPGVESFSRMMEAFIAESMQLMNLMGYHFLENQPECMEIKPQPEKKPALPVAAERVPVEPEPPQRLAGNVAETPPAKPRAAKYDFYVMGLKDGDVLVYEDKDPAHRTEAVVCGPDKIKVNGEVMTPHALAKRIRQTNNVYAFAYLSWKGEKLCNIYNRIYHPDMGQGAKNDKNLRYFTVAGADAVGRLTDDGGITVLKGSRLCAETKASCPKVIAALRAELPVELPTAQDFTFPSLTAAAAFVGGCALNGPRFWLETRKAPKRRKKS